jgi:dipeptidyl aminopeptidase/acylaminoacyl peptidase
VLAAACSSDSEEPGAANTEPSSSPTVEVTEPSRVSVSAPRPFVLVPLSKTPETWPIDRNISGVLVYDTATGRTTVAAEAGGGAYWHSWLNESDLLVRLDNRVTIYDAAAGQYRALDLGFDLHPNSSAMASPDGLRIVIAGREQELVFADLRSMTFRRVSLMVYPDSWSPDSSRLVVRVPDSGSHVVIEFDRPESLVRLPEAGYYSGWVNNFQVLANAHTLVDVRTPDRPQELPGVERGHFSPDGSYIATSHVIADSLDPSQRRFATAVYSLEPFGKVAELEDIALCCTQTRNVWTSDSSHFVALRNLCKEDESLVMVSVEDGAVTELSRAGTSQVAVSPDDRRVAFAHNTQEGAWLPIVPADSSSPPRPITEQPLGYPAANLQWSPDGRLLAFTIGGYGRCP